MSLTRLPPSLIASVSGLADVAAGLAVICASSGAAVSATVRVQSTARFFFIFFLLLVYEGLRTRASARPGAASSPCSPSCQNEIRGGQVNGMNGRPGRLIAVRQG